MLKVLQTLFKEIPISTIDRTVVKLVVNTELVKDIYKAKVEKYREKVLDCNNKYSQAYSIIQLSCENSLYIYIKGIENLYKI